MNITERILSGKWYLRWVAIAARFMPERQVLTAEQAKAIHVNPDYCKDISDAIFMTTRPAEGADDLAVYDRTFPEGFIRPGIGAKNWVSRSNYPALNVVPTGPAEVSIYVNYQLLPFERRPTKSKAIINQYELAHFGQISTTRMTQIMWLDNLARSLPTSFDLAPLAPYEAGRGGENAIRSKKPTSVLLPKRSTGPSIQSTDE